MKRPSRIIVGLLLVGVIIAGLYIALNPREPRANGQRLSYWVEQLWSAGADQEEAKSAIRKIGTNAVPALLRKVRGAEWRRKKMTAWSQLPPAVQAILPPPENDGHFLENKVPYALSLLGPSTIPLLLAALQDPDRKLQSVAVRALGMMGPSAEPALPTLIRSIQHTNGEVRIAAVHALQSIGRHDEEVIQALITALRDDNAGPDGGKVFVRESAAMALGRFGPIARPAIPELTRLMDDPEFYMRREAILALWRIGGDTNTVARLIDELQRRLSVHEYKATLDALGQIGEAAKPAIPEILDSMGLWGTDMSKVVRPVLMKIDTNAAAALDLNHPSP